MRQPTLDKIPETTLLIVAVGEEDLVVGDHRGRQIFTEASAIPPSRSASSCSARIAMDTPP